MSCEVYLDLISARLDGELTAQEEQQLSDHLRVCPQCRAIAEELKGVHSALTDLEQVQPPEELSRKVMEQIRQEKHNRTQTARRRTFRQLAGLAACLLLCVGVYRMSGPQIGAETAQEGPMAAQFRAEDQLYTADSVYSPEVGETAQTKAAAASKSELTAGAGADACTSEPDHYFFCNDQYFCVSVGEGQQVPSAWILGSTTALADCVARFPGTDLPDLARRYDADYFKTGRLLAVMLEEPNSSNRHRLAAQGLRYDQVTVLRQVSPAGDSVVTGWLILAEVDTMFDEGQQLQVVLKDQP